MKINISKLDTGISEWEEIIEPAKLELSPDQFNSPIKIGFHVDKGFGKIRLNVSAFTTGLLVCDRCGEDFQQQIFGRHSVFFVQREESLPDEMPGDETRSFLSGQHDLDVTVEVLDAILLSIPMQNICTGDCKGLCINCGVNLNHEKCSCSHVSEEDD